jgi:hypothetical protein
MWVVMRFEESDPGTGVSRTEFQTGGGNILSESSPSLDARQAKSFDAALKRHGHPFQYAVIRRAEELHRKRSSPWLFEVSEFPVEVQGYHTRIDFILSQRANGLVQGPFRYLIAECKRPNPSLTDWLFVRAPYVRRNDFPGEILVERVQRKEQGLAAGISRLHHSDRLYHIGFEIRGASKGDSSGPARGAIEDSATQVLRGLNGFVQFFAKHQSYLIERSHVTFIPAIFTTARVWATDEDISSANLADGEFSFDSSAVNSKEWLWLQYHMSPGLKHSVERDVPEDEPLIRTDMGSLLRFEYARTIAVVGQNGIDAFLESGLWRW